MNELKVICPFCNAPYTASLEEALSSTMDCDTCGTSVEGIIDIICNNCEKIVYRKEV